MSKKSKPKAKRDVTPKKTNRKPRLSPRPLNQQLIHALESFLTDLDCSKELYDTVMPILAHRDETRRKKIKDVSEYIDGLRRDNDQKRLQIDGEKLISELTELHDAVTKLNRANMLFQHNSIVVLVSRFDQFLGDAFRIIYKTYPDRLKGTENAITYSDLVQLKSIDEAVDRIIDTEVDKQLRDSHFNKLQYLDKQMKLGLQQYIDCWPTFIELTERRHLFAHTGGKVSEQYLDVCKKHNVQLVPKLQLGKVLDAPQMYYDTAVECIYCISTIVAQTLFRSLFPKNNSDADRELNSVGFELLKRERWSLADRIFAFALSIPQKLISSDEYVKMLTINRCIALRYSKKKADMTALLDAIDWSAANSKFVMAVNVLRDKYAEAESLMRTMDGHDPIDEHGFRTWPLFRDFRNTDNFRRAFKKIYKKDYEPAVDPQLTLLDNDKTDSA